VLEGIVGEDNAHKPRYGIMKDEEKKKKRHILWGFGVKETLPWTWIGHCGRVSDTFALGAAHPPHSRDLE
jgi:hypothetical protein